MIFAIEFKCLSIIDNHVTVLINIGYMRLHAVSHVPGHLPKGFGGRVHD
jgi:hypothetical protein